MNKTDSKEQILKSIALAKNRLLNEQEIYRIKLNDPPIDKNMAIVNLEIMAWPDLLNSLHDYYYPVDSCALKAYLVEPIQFQSDTQTRIEKIEDLDIRYALYFFNDIRVHTQRIKAAAELHYQFGDLDNFEEIASHWLTYSQCIEISKGIDSDTELITYNKYGNNLQFQQNLNYLLLFLKLGMDKKIIEG